MCSCQPCALAGTGLVAKRACKAVGPTGEVHGLDFSEGMLQEVSAAQPPACCPLDTALCGFALLLCSALVPSGHRVVRLHASLLCSALVVLA